MSEHTASFEKRTAFYEKLVTVSLFFAPYTLLRLGRIGISEFCIIVLVAFVLSRGRIRLGAGSLDKFIFTRFWFIFLAVSSLGFIYNYFFLGFPSGTLQGMIFDTASYLFVFVSCLVLESIITSHMIRLDIWEILKKTYFAASIALGILFLLGRLTNSSYIMYYAFFRPFATNIHHVSMFIAPLPFIGLKMLIETKGIFRKLVLVLLIVSNIFTGILTGSTKVFLALIAGGGLILLAMPFSLRMSRYSKLIVLSLMSLVVLLGVLAFAPELGQKAVAFFEENDIGGGRNLLYNSAIKKFSNSPLVGYGPGSHAELGLGFYSDAHQTHLTALLQAGFIGLLAYFYLTVVVFKKCLRDPFILGAYMAILIYSLGGDILRRLPMWIFIILFYYYCMFEKPFFRSSL